MTEFVCVESDRREQCPVGGGRGKRWTRKACSDGGSWFCFRLFQTPLLGSLPGSLAPSNTSPKEIGSDRLLVGGTGARKPISVEGLTVAWVLGEKGCCFPGFSPNPSLYSMAANQPPTGAQPQSDFLARPRRGWNKVVRTKYVTVQHSQGMGGHPNSSFIALLLNFYDTKISKRS